MLGASHFDRATLSYGLAHFGKSLFWYASEILFAFYLSEVCDLPVAWMGVVLASGFVCGAVSDLMVGRMCAGLLSTVSGAARLQGAGAFLCAVTMALVFAGALVPAPCRLAYALLGGAAFRVCYALFDLPQNALLSLATGNDDGRSRVSALRIFFSGAASLLVGASIGPLLASGFGGSVALRFFLLSLLLGLVAVGTALWLRHVLKRTMADAAPMPPMPLRAALSGFPWLLWLMIAISLITATTVSVFGKIEPYYAAYVLRAPMWGGLIMAAVACGQALSQPLWSHMARSLTRARMIALCAGFLVLSAGVFWSCARWPLAAAASAFVFGMASGGMGMVQWAAFGDVVARVPASAAGAAYGLLTATIKVALAAGGLLIGPGLGLFDYRGAQSEGLLAAMCLPVMAGGLLVVGLSLLPSLCKRTGPFH